MDNDPNHISNFISIEKEFETKDEKWVDVSRKSGTIDNTGTLIKPNILGDLTSLRLYTACSMLNI